jgi:hypothetical protein
VHLRSVHCIVEMLNGAETTFSYCSGRHRSMLLGDNAFVQTVPFHVSGLFSVVQCDYSSMRNLALERYIVGYCVDCGGVY